MKKNTLSMISAVTLLAVSIPVTAESPADQPSQVPPNPAEGQHMPFSRKAVEGVPHFPTRTMSNTRGAPVPGGKMPQLYVLLPEEVAVTTDAQPTLFWYLSRPVAQPIKLTLSTPDSIEPILELEIDASKRQGIQRLDLSRLPVRLKPSVRYDWVISTTADISGVTQNVYAKSVVWRIDTPKAMSAKLMGAKNRRQRAAIAAEEGIWIDALSGISNLIEHKPMTYSLRRDRADLLRQVGFQVVIKPQGDEGYNEEIEIPTTVQLGSASH